MPASTVLTDIGLNLASPQFARDRQEVLARARAAGVHRFVLTGVSMETSAECAALVDKVAEGDCYFTVGVHPHHAATLGQGRAFRLRELLTHPRAVAGGETGLDYFRDIAPRAVQRQAFSLQVELAIEAGKPLFLHERQAHKDFVAVLAGFGKDLPRCVVHCFTGTSAEARDYVERGYYIGITGWIGQRRRNADLLAAMADIPLDRLLLETDAPYLTPDGVATHVPRRNEPEVLPKVAELVAHAKGIPLPELAAAVENNTRLFFGWQ